MVVFDMPPVVFEPPALAQEVRKKRRSRSSSRSYGNRKHRGSYRVTGPVGVALFVGMWLILDDNGQRCQVEHVYADGTADCGVYW